MNVAALRERLLRGAAATPPASRTAVRRGRRRLVPGTYIVGERMTPLGCDCRAFLLDTSSHTTNTQNAVNEKSQCRRRRVTLPGMLPGMIVRTPAHYFDSIVSTQALPHQAHHIAVLRNVHTESMSQRSTRLPCALAAAHTCTQCPWMALGAQLSSQIKQNVLRRVIEDCRRGSQHRVLPVTYCEPFVVPVRTNRQQEVAFDFVRSTLTTGGGDLFSHRSGDGGAFVLEGEQSKSSSTAVCAAQECMLCTLEQKRLCDSLTRWSRTLPTSVVEQLCAAYVLQPAHTVDAGQPWESDLIVTLYLHRASESGSVQASEQHSPLCGPGHPNDLLATHEQSLVDAVLASAPLIKNIEVHVCFSDGMCDRLYPRLTRHLTLAELVTRSHEITSKQRGSAMPLRCCRCYCGSAATAVTIAPLPLCHSALWWRHGRGDGTNTTVNKSITLTSISMWRQCGALESVCSVLLSLLCENDTTTSNCETATPAMSLWYYDSYSAHDSNYLAHCTRKWQQQQERRSAAQSFGRHGREHKSKYTGKSGVADVEAGSFLLATTLRAAVEKSDMLPGFSSPTHLWPTIPTTTAKNTNGNEDVRGDCDVVLALLTEGERDARHVCALLTQLARQQQQETEGRRVRLVLVCCSTDMTLQPLQEVLTRLCQNTLSTTAGSVPAWRVTSASCGVIDVDVLAASLVAYSVVDVCL